jgi:VCBS repeat-containing protein
LPFKGQLSAPAGSTDITPLTTLLTNLASDPSAETKVLSNLGLSSTLDLTTFDPIAAAQGGSADGAATEIAGEKVYDTVEMIASALAGAGGSFTPSLLAAFSSLASALDGTGINLSDKAALSTLITRVAQTESVSLPNGVADTLASVITAGNAALDQVLQTDQPGTQLLSDAAGIELIEQGAASTAITNAAGSLTHLLDLANLFTGANLSELISQGQSEAQNPGQDLGPIAFNGSGTTDQNTVLNGTVSAIDLAGNSITYALDGTAPAGLTFKSDGTFTFDPGSAYKYLGVGESTSLSFQFTASDGQGTDSTATETITVNGLNDPPVAHADTNGLAKGTTISVSAAKGVLTNDSDPDIDDHLSVSSVNGSASNVGSTIQGKYGSLTLGADGSYVYKADPGSLPSQIVAQDTFSYSVSDGHGGVANSTLSLLVFNPSMNYQSGGNTTLVSNGIQPNVLDGSAGNDVLVGGRNGDVLIGGSGDKLTGGGGPDTFVFRPDFGANTITDFNVNNNAIQFDNSIFASISDILKHTADTAHGAVISDGHGDTVTLPGVTLAQLQAHQSDFHLV